MAVRSIYFTVVVTFRIDTQALCVRQLQRRQRRWRRRRRRQRLFHFRPPPKKKSTKLLTWINILLSKQFENIWNGDEARVSVFVWCSIKLAVNDKQGALIAVTIRLIIKTYFLLQNLRENYYSSILFCYNGRNKKVGSSHVCAGLCKEQAFRCAG